MVDDPGRDAVRHRSLTLLRLSQEIKPLVSVRGLYESDESVIRRPLLKS